MLKPKCTSPKKSMLPTAKYALIFSLLSSFMSCEISEQPDIGLQWIALVMLLLAIVFFVWYRLHRTLKDYRILAGRQKALIAENSRLAEEIRDLRQNEKDDSTGESISSVETAPSGSQEDVDPVMSAAIKEEDADTEQEETDDKGGSMLVSQVSHVWVQGNYIHYKIKDNPRYHMRRDSLRNVYARLQQHDFVQTHKSYLINLAMVSQVKGQEVILEDGSKVPLSRKYKEAFREEYKRYNPIDF